MTTYLLVIMRWICGCLVKGPATGTGVSRIGLDGVRQWRFERNGQRSAMGMVAWLDWMNDVVTWLCYGVRPRAIAPVMQCNRQAAIGNRWLHSGRRDVVVQNSIAAPPGRNSGYRGHFDSGVTTRRLR